MIPDKATPTKITAKIMFAISFSNMVDTVLVKQKKGEPLRRRARPIEAHMVSGYHDAIYRNETPVRFFLPYRSISWVNLCTVYSVQDPS